MSRLPYLLPLTLCKSLQDRPAHKVLPVPRVHRVRKVSRVRLAHRATLGHKARPVRKAHRVRPVLLVRRVIQDRKAQRVPRRPYQVLQARLVHRGHRVHRAIQV